MPLGLQHVLISSRLVTIKKAENYGLLTNILFSSPVLPHLSKGNRNSLKICSSSNFSNVKDSTFEYFELSQKITLQKSPVKTTFIFVLQDFFVCFLFFFKWKELFYSLIEIATTLQDTKNVTISSPRQETSTFTKETQFISQFISQTRPLTTKYINDQSPFILSSITLFFPQQK